MANNLKMDSLKGNAIQVYPGMIAVYPQLQGRESTLNLSELAPKFNGCYATNNSTVCFVLDDQVFVTPYTRNTIRNLSSEGFREKVFYVPFSNGDYPKAEQIRWRTLRANAEQSYKEDFQNDCLAYCDEHHIGTISDETLKNCFEMPATGVKVKHFYYEECYYPIIDSNCLDCVAVERIGKYCSNNGRVVFVYRDGKTYVAKGYKIINELQEAGYREKGLFVPFSNGEKILDPVLRSKWESITK